MKKMSNKKKMDILETALGLWTGICFGGWLCNAIECKDAEALLFIICCSLDCGTGSNFLPCWFMAGKKEKQSKEAGREVY